MATVDFIKDRPIDLSSNEINSALNGQLTNILRPVLEGPWYTGTRSGGQWDANVRNGISYWSRLLSDGSSVGQHTKVRCPYGSLEHTLWARERWYKNVIVPRIQLETLEYYSSWIPNVMVASVDGEKISQDICEIPKWNSSESMEKDISRLFFRIDDVTVQPFGTLSLENLIESGYNIDPADALAHQLAYKSIIDHWIIKYGRHSIENSSWVWNIKISAISRHESNDR